MSCQTQNTEISRPPWVKVTRIHVGCFQSCICQPDAGVAETSSAESGPMSKTTRPPATDVLLIFPWWDGGVAGVSREADGVRDGAGLRLGPGAVPGEPEGDVEAEGPALPGPSGVADEEPPVAGTSGVSAVMGSARGGSYAVPAITVCTPHHDSVTAAPVASDHAKT